MGMFMQSKEARMDFFDKYYTDANGSPCLYDGFLERLHYMLWADSPPPEEKRNPSMDPKNNPLCVEYEPKAGDDLQHLEMLRLLYFGYKEGKITKDDYLNLVPFANPTNYQRRAFMACGIAI